MRRIGFLLIILLGGLSLGQELDCVAGVNGCYMFVVATQYSGATKVSVLEDFVTTVRGGDIGDAQGQPLAEQGLELVEQGRFEVDISRFSNLLTSEARESLLSEIPELLRPYFDVENSSADNATGSFFPLYFRSPGITDYSDERIIVNVEEFPCNGLMAFVKDLNNDSESALNELNKVRTLLESKYGAGVLYGPTADGSGSGGGSQSAPSLEPAVYSQATYYSYQPSEPNNVTIAVIDTGVIGSPDPFASSLDVPFQGYNFVESNTSPRDDYVYPSFDLHGSPVAYIASTDSEASSSITPKIMPVKVCDNNSTDVLNDDCKVSDIILGVCYALNNFNLGADPFNPEADPEQRLVINLSLGGETPVDLLGEVLWEAIDQNAVVVASGGNDAYVEEEGEEEHEERYYPAAFECRPSDSPCSYSYDSNGLISVSSVDGNGNPSSFSVAGAYNDVAALGEYTSGLLAGREGTSYATPVVSGVAAAILTQQPSASPEQVEACIRTIAQATNPLNPALGIGGGIIDPAIVLDNLGLCSF